MKVGQVGQVNQVNQVGQVGQVRKVSWLVVTAGAVALLVLGSGCNPQKRVGTPPPSTPIQGTDIRPEEPWPCQEEEKTPCRRK